MKLHRKKLATAEAADYLGLGKSSLDKLRLTGGGPVYIRIGTRILYDCDDLDNWIAKHRVTASTAPVAA